MSETPWCAKHHSHCPGCVTPESARASREAAPTPAPAVPSVPEAEPLSDEELALFRKHAYNVNVSFPGREPLSSERLFATVYHWRGEYMSADGFRKIAEQERDQARAEAKETLDDLVQCRIERGEFQAERNEYYAQLTRAESELSIARERIYFLEHGDQHTCHEECVKTETCRLRYELAAARKEAEEWKAQSKQWERAHGENLERWQVREQEFITKREADVLAALDSARSWAQRWKRAAKIRRSSKETIAECDAIVQGWVDERDSALARVAELTEALERLVNSKALSETPMLDYSEAFAHARAVLSTPRPAADALKARHYREAAEIAERRRALWSDTPMGEVFQSLRDEIRAEAARLDSASSRAEKGERDGE